MIDKVKGYCGMVFLLQFVSLGVLQQGPWGGVVVGLDPLVPVKGTLGASAF